MRRVTKRRVSTLIGCAIGGLTLTGPLAGQFTADYQCKRGLCEHAWHRDRYRVHVQTKAFRKATR